MDGAGCAAQRLSAYTSRAGAAQRAAAAHRSQAYASRKSSSVRLLPSGLRVCSTIDGAEYISALTQMQWKA